MKKGGLKEVPLSEVEKFSEYDHHERVFRIEDAQTGLRGFIAIHNTNRGAAVGGTRLWHYADETEALRDDLRLSRAMTYKCALADVPYGGGKAVLLTPKNGWKNKNACLESYARCLKTLETEFFTGEDVGMDDEDVRFLASRTGNIIGHPDIGGLPGPWAARSVYVSMEAALEVVFGSASLHGRTVAVKGIGHAGMELCKLIHAAGAQLIAADTDSDKIAAAEKIFPGIRIVDPDHIAEEQVDVYSPCALGGEFNASTVGRVKAKIICGAANNQLDTPDDGRRLFERDILYIPDYVANSGGLINVVDELQLGGYNRDRVQQSVDHVKETVRGIIRESRDTHTPTNEIADSIGRRRFETPRFL